MSYKIRYSDGGVEFTADSAEEAVQLAKMLTQPTTNGHVPTASRAMQAAAAEPPAPAPSGNILGVFVGALTDEAKVALRMILANEGALDVDQLCRMLDFANGSVLAGSVIGPISKAAKKAGLNPDSILLRKPFRNDSGKRTNAYAVPAAIRGELERALNM